jgi:hypothetical protein
MSPACFSAMRLRPFYRWKCFWCGTAILAFIAWTAIRSFSVSDQVSWKGGVSIWTISQHTGRIILTYVNTADWYFPEGVSFAQIEGPVAETWFPPAIELDSFPVSAVAKGTNYQVAHWVVALLFVLLWIPYMVRRHCRIATGLTRRLEKSEITEQGVAPQPAACSESNLPGSLPPST